MTAKRSSTLFTMMPSHNESGLLRAAAATVAGHYLLLVADVPFSWISRVSMPNVTSFKLFFANTLNYLPTVVKSRYGRLIPYFAIELIRTIK